MRCWFLQVHAAQAQAAPGYLLLCRMANAPTPAPEDPLLHLPQPVNREALHQRMDSVDLIEDASAEPMDSPQAGQPPRFRARSAAAPVPPGPFAPSQEMLHQAYGDTFAMR